MNNLNINVTKHEAHTDNMIKVQAGNRTFGLYDLYKDFTVWNFIEINGVKYHATYQTSCSYLHNDYTCPNPDLELSDTNTHKLLSLINELYASDFDNANLIQDFLFDINALCKDIDTVSKLRQVYDCLMDNVPNIHEYAV